jgi:peptidoglycan/xylan/chitin deacetylase (PgdA/CDA1 family)
MIRIAVFGMMLAACSSAAASCPGNADALGTARVLTVDVTKTPRVGKKHFPDTLPLAPKEVVLTFDDGPWPGTTDQILAALKKECVKATFFMLGRSAASWPAIAQHVAADGHSIGHHSHTHPLLKFLSQNSAESDIDRGIAAIEAATGHPGNVAAFFRFPGFASSPALLAAAEKRGMVVFGADAWASDWNPMSADVQLKLILERVEASHGGIVLFHDTKKQTAAMLPAFLHALKRRGFSVVHVVPAQAEAVVAAANPLRRSW